MCSAVTTTTMMPSSDDNGSFFCTTRTMVGKTRFASGKEIKLNIVECMEFFSKYIFNDKKVNSIIQLRTGFKNAFTCDLYLLSFNKQISMKICKNGSFQFTGNITLQCAYEAIQYVISLLKLLYPKMYEKDTCEIYIYEVMSNFVLDLNRPIEPDSLMTFFQTIAPHYNNYTCFNSQTSGTFTCKYNVGTTEVMHRNVSFFDEVSFVEHVPYKDCVSSKKLGLDERKDYYITFLVFQSGKVIVSGINETIVERVCRDFCLVVKNYFDTIADSGGGIFQHQPLEISKKIMKRTCYEKISLVKIEDDQYIIVRGKSNYVNSRKSKLASKYSLCKTIYENDCLNINVCKELKNMLKNDKNVHFSNVGMTTSLDENIIISHMEKCNTAPAAEVPSVTGGGTSVAVG